LNDRQERVEPAQVAVEAVRAADVHAGTIAVPVSLGAAERLVGNDGVSPSLRWQTSRMKFSAILELGGKTATGIEVPAEVLAELGSSRRPAVWVTINGYRYRSTVGSMGGRAMLPVSAEVRAQAQVAAGDNVAVELELDDAPRTVEVPADFAAALAAHEPAQRAFDSLSYSNQRRHVLSVEGAKTAQTRERRIAKSIDELAGAS
jgi:hypothetical protein